jgi:hypothetical protein
MDKKYNKENSLIERYLENRLSTAERDMFEERLLSSPQLLDEFEAAERLQQGLQDLVAMEKAHPPPDQRAAGKRSGHIASIFNSPRYAMAASFLLLISMGISSFLLNENERLSEAGPAYAMPAEIVPLVSVRSAAGSDPINTLVLGDSSRQFVMMLDPGFEEYAHYRASVYRLDQAGARTMLWQVDEMIPGYEEMLALSVPGAVLSPGEFEIALEGWRDEWPAGHEFEPVDTLNFKCMAK